MTSLAVCDLVAGLGAFVLGSGDGLAQANDFAFGVKELGRCRF